MANKIDLTLHAIQGYIVAFTIEGALYFMRLEPIPQVFDDHLKLQIIPNIDTWFQAKTQQRYSHQGFLDMVRAFQAGLAKSYALTDLQAVAHHTVIATKIALLDRLGVYRKHYWIEVLDPVKIETQMIPQIREQFDNLRHKLGDDLFYNNLCRLWKMAQRHRPGMAPIVERLIKRLDRSPADPVWPMTPELDSDLTNSVLAQVLDKRLTAYKATPTLVQAGLEILNGPAAS